MRAQPLVSVLIRTMGRATLARAVDSVAQCRLDELRVQPGFLQGGKVVVVGNQQQPMTWIVGRERDLAAIVRRVIEPAGQQIDVRRCLMQGRQVHGRSR